MKLDDHDAWPRDTLVPAITQQARRWMQGAQKQMCISWDFPSGRSRVTYAAALHAPSAQGL